MQLRVRTIDYVLRSQHCHQQRLTALLALVHLSAPAFVCEDTRQEPRYLAANPDPTKALQQMFRGIQHIVITSVTFKFLNLLDHSEAND